MRDKPSRLLNYLKVDGSDLFAHFTQLIDVGDERGFLIGPIRTWKPWLLVLLKLAAYPKRSSGSKKDLLDVR